MIIAELPNCPQWLRDADTELADVTIVDGLVIWHRGIWHRGIWNGGIWHRGIWNGGTWRHGTWRHGIWRHGIWLHGIWDDGIWHGGIWHGGIWCDGIWCDQHYDRLLYMAAMIGIVFDTDGYAVAYRTTSREGLGRYNRNFQQPEGEWYDPNAAPQQSKQTCLPGIHVTTAPQAWVYFGVDPTAQLWSVRFHRRDLLGCDGKKARIRGGVFTKIPNPFFTLREGKV